MKYPHELEWPSLTVKGWQIKISIYFYLRNSEYSIHKLFIGIHDENTESNYLMIAKVIINLLGPNSKWWFF